MFALSIDPIRRIAFVPILLIFVGALVAFTGVFSVWVWRNTRCLTRSEEQDSIFLQADAVESGAASIRKHLCLHFRTAKPADLFAAAGALAGFACQMVVRDQAQLEGRPSGLYEIALADGRLLYSGDVLNGPLAEDAASLWSIVGDGAPVADILHMFKDAIAALTEDPESPILKALVTVVQRHWPATVAILDANHVPATFRHLTIARAIRAVQHSQTGLPPDHVARMVMGAAIVMSKWDPADVLVPDQAVGTTPAVAGG